MIRMNRFLFIRNKQINKNRIQLRPKIRNDEKPIRCFCCLESPCINNIQISTKRRRHPLKMRGGNMNLKRNVSLYSMVREAKQMRGKRIRCVNTCEEEAAHEKRKCFYALLRTHQNSIHMDYSVRLERPTGVSGTNDPQPIIIPIDTCVMVL